jgi:hypothetical protein
MVYKMLQSLLIFRYVILINPAHGGDNRFASAN